MRLVELILKVVDVFFFFFFLFVYMFMLATTSQAACFALTLNISM